MRTRIVNTGLRRGARGAVLVEFIVAFTPLMITFFGFVQLQQLATAALVVEHSAIIGARGAAVMSNVRRNTPDQPDSDNVDLIRKGVLEGLGTWENAMEGVDVTVDDTSTCKDPYGMVSVTVTAHYKCSVPMANIFLCGTGKTFNFKPQTARFPHQGARYQDLSGAKACER